MSERIKNLKSLFRETRTRTILILSGVLGIATIVIGILYMGDRLAGPESGASLTSSPTIESIPGSLNPTQQYAELQEKQNIEKARRALESGQSALPTIIRTQKIGEGQDLPRQGGLGFARLSKQAQLGGGSKKSLWIDNLKTSNCSSAAVRSATSLGATLSDLSEVCNCAQLKANGYDARALRSVCSATKLKAAGFNALQLKNAGFDAAQLRAAGFDACQVKGVGFSAQQMKEAGYSDGELKGAGFSDQEIKSASGLPEGMAESDVANAGCDVEALRRLHAAGVSVRAIRRISGCPVSALKAAGFNASQMKLAGFKPAELMAAGYNPVDLLQAGYQADDLKPACLSADRLKTLGVTADQLKSAGFSSDNIQQAGYCAATLRQAGYSVADARQSGMSAAQLFAAGYTPASLINGGFVARELESACLDALRLQALGYTQQQLLNLGFDANDFSRKGFAAQEIPDVSAQLPVGVTSAQVTASNCDIAAINKLRDRGVSAAAIRKILPNCPVTNLVAAGFIAEDLKPAGFSPAEICVGVKGLAPGMTAAEIANAECTEQAVGRLRQRGVSAYAMRIYSCCSIKQLSKAGYSLEELGGAGYDNASIQSALAGLPEGVRVSDVHDAGCSSEALNLLRNRGVTAAAVREFSNCSDAALARGGYEVSSTTSEILKELCGSDCNQADLAKAKAAGISADQIRSAAGCSLQALRSAGFSNFQLRQAGYSPAELRLAGVSNEDLRAAGFNAREMRESGLSAADLRKAGYSANAIKSAGFSASDLLAAGMSAKSLKDSGFTLDDLKNAGLNAKQLSEAGFSIKELQEAGFSGAQLKQAGFSAKELNEAGFNLQQLRELGFTVAELKSAGFKQVDLEFAGLVVPTEPRVEKPMSEVEKRDAELKQILEQQAAQLSEQEVQQRISQKTGAIYSQMQATLAGWQPVTQVYIGGAVAKDAEEQASLGLAGIGGVPVGQQRGVAQQPRPKPLAKAGDIVFAVMETSVNSDEPGPILATIVSGKLRGTKLIGSFNLPARGQKLIITFNRASIPSEDHTISLSAVAIDPDTARTALSSHTDNHYLLRYGSLFAASFIEGVGQAITESGVEITHDGTAGGTTTTRTANRTTDEKLLIGLGAVGEAWGNEARQFVNTPPTVRIYSGTSIGVLFTSDLEAPNGPLGAQDRPLEAPNSLS